MLLLLLMMMMVVVVVVMISESISAAIRYSSAVFALQLNRRVIRIICSELTAVNLQD